MKRLVACLLELAVVAGCLAAADTGGKRWWSPVEALATAAKTPGVDLAGIDRSVAPGDNFFAYANGAWDKATPIPADRSSYGVDSMLVDEARKRTVALIQESANGGKGEEARKIGDFYASFVDEAGTEAKGLKPLKPEIDAIAAISDKRALARAMGGALRSDVDPLNATNFYTDHLFGLFVAQALDDPSRNVPYLLAGRPRHARPRVLPVRQAADGRAAHQIPGARRRDAQARRRPRRRRQGEGGAHLRARETHGQVHATRVESEDVRDAVSWKREELSTRAPGLDWAAFLEAAALQKEPRFFIWHPKATTGLAALVGSEPLDTWKDWLTYHAIEHAAPWLPKAFVAERFAFYGKALTGTPQQRERWKRGVDFTNDALGEAVGKLYVQRYFSPEAKAKAQAMCDDLVKAFGRRIDTLDWMSPQTRTKAKEKLATLKIGVGYPDSWRDYSALQVVRGDALGNATRAELFEYRRNLAKLGKAPDRSEWWMTPQTVNAVNLPLQNALNFPGRDPPAAVLRSQGRRRAQLRRHRRGDRPRDQPQLRRPGEPVRRAGQAQQLVDEGRLRPFQGRLREARRAVRRATSRSPIWRSTGIRRSARTSPTSPAWLRRTTLSSCRSEAGRPARQGFTGDQQFFISFAQSWRTKSREAALRSQIVTDGHAPAEYRADTVRNLDAWYGAFQVKPGQKLYLAPADRVRVW